MEALWVWFLCVRFSLVWDSIFSLLALFTFYLFLFFLFLFFYSSKYSNTLNEKRHRILRVTPLHYAAWWTLCCLSPRPENAPVFSPVPSITGFMEGDLWVLCLWFMAAAVSSCLRVYRNHSMWNDDRCAVLARSWSFPAMKMGNENNNSDNTKDNEIIMIIIMITRVIMAWRGKEK